MLQFGEEQVFRAWRRIWSPAPLPIRKRFRLTADDACIW